MKAILKFNLDEPEDEQAHERCCKAKEMAIILWKIENNLLSEIKTANPDLSIHTASFVIREIQNYMEKYRIDINDLID
jgi:hypothetical protein